MDLDLATRRDVLRLSTGALVSLAPFMVAAADFPSRRIRCIAPFPAGGIVDQVARALSDDIAADLRQPVVIEALPGAGGAIGTQEVAKSEPDGHTWLMATPSHVALPYLQRTSYDPIKHFQAVAVVGNGRAVAVVPTSSPARTMSDFVRLAKSRPGELNYLNAGTGSVAHLSTELLKLNSGISVQGVAYKGLPPGVQDLAAGRLDFGFVSLQVALPMMKAGHLRAIGISTPVREADLPDVPTLEEQGFANSYVPGWYLICVPAATPASVVERINAAVNKTLSSPAVRQRLATAFVTPASPHTPAQSHQLLVSDHLRIGKIIKDANIKAG
jgi:tripartite-type tricarboxylate transporter receptor subunit TctC